VSTSSFIHHQNFKGLLPLIIDASFKFYTVDHFVGAVTAAKNQNDKAWFTLDTGAVKAQESRAAAITCLDGHRQASGNRLHPAVGYEPIRLRDAYNRRRKPVDGGQRTEDRRRKTED
jgi:hypothetical protein